MTTGSVAKIIIFGAEDNQDAVVVFLVEFARVDPNVIVKECTHRTLEAHEVSVNADEFVFG